LGYQVGAPDGIAGAKTRDAIKSFEAVNGLPQTGEISDELLDSSRKRARSITPPSISIRITD